MHNYTNLGANHSYTLPYTASVIAQLGDITIAMGTCSRSSGQPRSRRWGDIPNWPVSMKLDSTSTGVLLRITKPTSLPGTPPPPLITSEIAQPGHLTTGRGRPSPTNAQPILQISTRKKTRNQYTYQLLIVKAHSDQLTGHWSNLSGVAQRATPS